MKKYFKMNWLCFSVAIFLISCENKGDNSNTSAAQNPILTKDTSIWVKCAIPLSQRRMIKINEFAYYKREETSDYKRVVYVSEIPPCENRQYWESDENSEAINFIRQNRLFKQDQIAPVYSLVGEEIVVDAVTGANFDMIFEAIVDKKCDHRKNDFRVEGRFVCFHNYTYCYHFHYASGEIIKLN